ncbi:hypothetical protein PVAP13_8NG130000 [Panicum virgatum]|uniref:Uncharacterized protein n=1 Tax=Panicum virgatum TaxID=38727 RepID=A0A8T0PAY5_PANVG|nr:hypothetical protein PVAP13_8NG130000 [Panicum virgatum]
MSSEDIHAEAAKKRCHTIVSIHLGCITTEQAERENLCALLLVLQILLECWCSGTFAPLLLESNCYLYLVLRFLVL